MTQQILENGESKLAIRTKINENFEELFDRNKSNPTKLSEFENDVGFVTPDELPQNRDFIESPIDLESEVIGVLPINKVDVSSLPSGGNSPYDVVIRTQNEFIELYSSPDWLGATSVVFVGDGGTLKFTRGTTGLKIPQTVKRIYGFNNAIIRMTSFTYNATTNAAVLWYETKPETLDYSINGIRLESATFANTVYGFRNCVGLTNCICGFSSANYSFHSCDNLIGCQCLETVATTNGFGFYNCTKLVNCVSNILVGNNGGFHNCNYLVNCISNTSGGGVVGTVYGFNNCTQLLNCTGSVFAANLSGTVGYGFNNCSQLSNCTGDGHGAANSYAFNNCSYLNGCKEGTTISTTGIWGGTWLFRDDKSCQLTR